MSVAFGRVLWMAKCHVQDQMPMADVKSMSILVICLPDRVTLVKLTSPCSRSVDTSTLAKLVLVSNGKRNVVYLVELCTRWDKPFHLTVRYIMLFKFVLDNIQCC